MNGLAIPIIDAARVVWDGAAALRRRLDPRHRQRDAAIDRERQAALAAFSQIASGAPTRFDGTVLIDGSWYNPNYWWRLTLLRRALGTGAAREVGFLGKYQRRASARDFNALGISEILRHADFQPRDASLARALARELLGATASAEDVLKWELPFGYPAACAYDGILKHQRTAAVDPRDPWLRRYVVELIQSLEASSQLLDEVRPSLVLLSSAINFECGTLAWIAAQRGIPVVVLYGCFGVPRFWKVLPGDGIYKPLDGITAPEMDALPGPIQDALALAGRKYMDLRFAGGTRDHGAVYAFGVSDKKIDRAAFFDMYGWNPDKPIVAVYAANWFDFPKSFGGVQFRDFLDWINTTIDCAGANSGVNWLFRPHPCDEWYGGITLHDVVSDRGWPHVKLTPPRWNGAAVMNLADAVVTMHGTAAIEYSCFGKPALIADRGWYHEAGFALQAADRRSYAEALGRRWWDGVDMPARKRRAEIFAGWFFCHPAWQDSLVVDDDFRALELWKQFAALLRDSGHLVDAECKTIRDWFASDVTHLHSFKMAHATSFAV
jgi:hypothetical protein